MQNCDALVMNSISFCFFSLAAAIANLLRPAGVTAVGMLPLLVPLPDSLLGCSFGGASNNTVAFVALLLSTTMVSNSLSLVNTAKASSQNSYLLQAAAYSLPLSLML